MKLTLRKANAVQSAINEAIKSLDLVTQVTLNEFEIVADQIQKAREQFFENSAKRSSLVMALYEIRAKVAQANASAGINDFLTNVAYAEKQISHNNMLASKGEQTALQILNGQINKIANAKDEGYGYSRRDVTTSIFTKEEIDQFCKISSDYKKTKQKLQDQLLELNVQTEIELSASTSEFLVNADIL